MIETRGARYVMGTVVEITVWADDGLGLEAVDRAFAEFERLEKLYSRFDPESELSRINREAARRPVTVSDEIFDAIERALGYATHARGCFSISLGPIADVWRAAAERQSAPDERELRDAVARSDYRRVCLDRPTRSVTFCVEGMSLDLGGFAKGVAVDRAVALLKQSGVARAVVNAGESSIAVFGATPSDQDAGATIGARHPRQPERLAAAIRLRAGALSTSGTTERGVLVDGRWFSHVFDPRSGMPVDGASSATAVAGSAELAEVASKILLLLGCEAGIAACDEAGWAVEGLCLRADEHSAGVFVEHSGELEVELL